MPSLAQKSLLLFGGQSYIQKIANIQRSNLIALWPQNEGSGTVITDLSPEANNGAYTGVTWDGTKGPDGGSPVPYYDGANDVGNFYSAGFNVDFNGAKGAIAGWFKVSAAGVWTDGALRVIVDIYGGGSDQIKIYKNTVNNNFIAYYRTAGTTNSRSVTSYSPTGWIPYVVNFSDSANGAAMQLYLSGVQQGADVAIAGPWGGTLLSTACCLGANDITPTNVWSGYLGPTAIWAGYNLTAADIAAWGAV